MPCAPEEKCHLSLGYNCPQASVPQQSCSSLAVHYGGGGAALEEGREQPSLSPACHSLHWGWRCFPPLLCLRLICCCFLNRSHFAAPGGCLAPSGLSPPLWVQEHVLGWLQCPSLAALGAISPRCPESTGRALEWAWPLLILAVFWGNCLCHTLRGVPKVSPPWLWPPERAGAAVGGSARAADPGLGGSSLDP